MSYYSDTRSDTKRGFEAKRDSVQRRNAKANKRYGTGTALNVEGILADLRRDYDSNLTYASKPGW